MRILEKNSQNEIIIKKSKFINFLFIIEDEKDINKFLEQIKNHYKDATHYCYAYILNEKKYAFDDNEPTGTAGMPILKVLENNNLNYVLAITARYFGGIKLGSGGLIRAYAKSVNENLKKVKLCAFEKAYLFEIDIPYELRDVVEQNLKKYVETKHFSNSINYSLCANVEDFEKIAKLLNKFQIEITNLKETKKPID